jgi:hypothetical protein
MARAKRHRGPRGIRPGFLAGGLALAWFAQGQEGGFPTGVPMWGIGLMLGGRLLADFVGALLVVSALRLILTFVRLLVVRWRAQSRMGVQ